MTRLGLKGSPSSAKQASFMGGLLCVDEEIKKERQDLEICSSHPNPLQRLPSRESETSPDFLNQNFCPLQQALVGEIGNDCC